MPESAQYRCIRCFCLLKQKHVPFVLQSAKEVQLPSLHGCMASLPSLPQLQVTQRRLSTEEFSHPRVEALIDETPEVTLRLG